MRKDRLGAPTTILLKPCLYRLSYVYIVDICTFVQVCHSHSLSEGRSALLFIALAILDMHVHNELGILHCHGAAMTPDVQ